MAAPARMSPGQLRLHRKACPKPSRLLQRHSRLLRRLRHARPSAWTMTVPRAVASDSNVRIGLSDTSDPTALNVAIDMSVRRSVAATALNVRIGLSAAIGTSVRSVVATVRNAAIDMNARLSAAAIARNVRIGLSVATDTSARNEAESDLLSAENVFRGAIAPRRRILGSAGIIPGRIVDSQRHNLAAGAGWSGA